MFMILQSALNQVIETQKANLFQKDPGLKRDALAILPNLTAFALIVSGIRRCGKSTLLFQLLKERYPDALYLNFEDPRLYEFGPNDFSRLDESIKASGSKVLFFDEIQIVPEWERYARQKLDEEYKLVITGSNASLLSRELGTRLTGRHISKELFPFSYHEFCSFKGLVNDKQSLLSYLELGGFPEYLKQGIPEILNQLFEDILIRDIAVRYGVRDVKTLQRLAFYLLSNVSKLITGNRLKILFEIGSTSTVMEYLSYLEYSYLLQFVPKFSYSLRKQIANPRKVYAIDTGLINVNSGSFSEDNGRKFENLIYLHLRQKYREIYYFAEKNECDFVIINNGTLVEAIQVCFELNPDNITRELNGVIDALTFFNADEGFIVTLDQTDRLEKNGKVVHVMPAHHYLLK
jgi:predicted AAA+ superfamily ATPase